MSYAAGQSEPSTQEKAPSRAMIPIDLRVREALCSLATRYKKKGVRVFLFGSVASTWPLALKGADFDIGFEWISDAVDKRTLLQELETDIAALPTIRPIDLVDFSFVSSAFRGSAQQLDFAHEPPITTED